MITIDKDKFLGTLGDELGQMAEIRPDLKTQILASASKALDLAEGLDDDPEYVIVDEDRSGYMTKAEIKAALSKMGVTYKSNATRNELLDLLERV